MHTDSFEDILALFPPSFAYVKPLRHEVSRILSLVSTEGKLFLGTPPEPGPLDDTIVEEFDDAIGMML